MTTDQEIQTAQPGAPALLMGRDRKTSIIRLEPGAEFHTYRGAIAHDDLIGSPWGSRAKTHLGHPLILLRPSADDMKRNLEHSVQIVCPEDAGYVLMKLNVAPSCRVVEAGTGSGGLTSVFARVEELIPRPYRTSSARLRPKDRLMPHTGYLVFARKLISSEE